MESLAGFGGRISEVIIIILDSGDASLRVRDQSSINDADHHFYSWGISWFEGVTPFLFNFCFFGDLF
jgi:hypothetical protein